MRDEVASHPPILPRSCSSVEADVLLQVSRDLFDDDPVYTFTTKLDATSLLCGQIRPWAV